MRLLDMDCQDVSTCLEPETRSAPVSVTAERLSLEVPIKVSSYDEGREPFTEETHTMEVTPWGGRIALKNWVYPNDVIRIINQANYFEADFRVVGLTNWDGVGEAEWAVECSEKGRTLWDVRFERENLPSVDEPGTSLECRVCHARGMFILSPGEIEVMKSTGIVVEHCTSCGKPTYWTYTDPTLRPPAYPPFEDVAPPPREVKMSAFINTRAHRRLPLQISIAIRNSKGEEEHCVTENISLAGFAVILSMPLAVNEIVTFVCANFSGGQAIPQKAECRWGASVTPGGTKHIYGFRTIAGSE